MRITMVSGCEFGMIHCILVLGTSAKGQNAKKLNVSKSSLLYPLEQTLTSHADTCRWGRKPTWRPSYSSTSPARAIKFSDNSELINFAVLKLKISCGTLGRLAQWSRSAGYAGGTIEGHTIPMTEVGCSEIRAL